ncbi:MAG: hypothetical protein ACRCU3_00055 [Eubacteriaceae bacterium]
MINVNSTLDLAFVAASITLLGVIFQQIVASKNKNITEERCKWRERLKELAVSIENSQDIIEYRKFHNRIKNTYKSPWQDCKG